VRFEFEFGIVSFYFSFTFVLFEESCLFVSWCAGGRCGIACSDEDRGRSRRSGADDRDGRTGRVFGGRAIERSGGACVICIWHVETRSASFLVEPQNQG
jgi:hypothetical protein